MRVDKSDTIYSETGTKQTRRNIGRKKIKKEDKETIQYRGKVHIVVVVKEESACFSSFHSWLLMYCTTLRSSTHSAAQ